MTKKKIYKIISLIFFNLILILIFLLIADPILGKLTVENEGVSRQINFKENKPLSYLKIASSQENGNNEVIIKRTDEFGLILGPNEKSTLKIDFIFLGSSTVESESVRENTRYPYLSIRKLNEKLGTNFTSRNAGVGGNLLSASNLALTTKILDIKPKYIVLSSSLIDMLYLSRNSSYWSGSKKYLIETNSGSSLLRSIKEIFFPNIWLQVRKYIFHSIHSDFKNNQFSPKDKKRILEQYGKQLEIFINTCLIYNITPILTTDYYVPEIVEENLVRKGIFNNEEVNYYLHTLIPELNKLIEDKANAYQVPLIKLQELVEINERFVNDEDGVHLTNEGSEKISEVISNYIARKIENEEI